MRAMRLTRAWLQLLTIKRYVMLADRVSSVAHSQLFRARTQSDDAGALEVEQELVRALTGLSTSDPWLQSHAHIRQRALDLQPRVGHHVQSAANRLLEEPLAPASEPEPDTRPTLTAVRASQSLPPARVVYRGSQSAVNAKLAEMAVVRVKRLPAGGAPAQRRTRERERKQRLEDEAAEAAAAAEEDDGVVDLTIYADVLPEHAGVKRKREDSHAAEPGATEEKAGAVPHAKSQSRPRTSLRPPSSVSGHLLAHERWQKLGAQPCLRAAAAAQDHASDSDADYDSDSAPEPTRKRRKKPAAKARTSASASQSARASRASSESARAKSQSAPAPPAAAMPPAAADASMRSEEVEASDSGMSGADTDTQRMLLETFEQSAAVQQVALHERADGKRRVRANARFND